MESSSIKHSYVYRIVEKSSEKFYIGYRTCLQTISPLDDLGVRYFTSGKFKSEFKKNPDLFDIEILDVFENKIDAYVKEQVLIESYFADPFCMNRNYDRNAVNKTNNGKIKLSPEFNQEIVNLSKSKKRKAIRKEIKRRKKVDVWNRNKKKLIQYCDIETRAVVYMVP